jgi:hypothetical protein
MVPLSATEGFRWPIDSLGYVLWVERSDRVRIHEMVRDYEVDVIPTDPLQTCEICTKKSPASPTSRRPETNSLG